MRRGAALVRAAARPKALGVALVIAVLGALPAPAFAAPELGITMTHANAYGQQVRECPTGKEEDFPGQPEQDCGVDPFTGSGTSFDRGSGDNEYTITVKNDAPQTASGSVVPGETLSCTAGEWEEHPTSFAFQWLRNGVPIAGGESEEYEVTTADEGAVLQCEVIAANAGSARAATSAATSVAPAPATVPPVLTAHPTASEEGERPVVVGETLACASGGWEGNPTFAYRWLRNGVPIAGAESDEYQVVMADEGAAIECQVTATNAGGSVVGENLYPIVVEPEYHYPVSPEHPNGEPQYPPYTEYNPGPAIPTPRPNETHGTVTVAARLPAGLQLVPLAQGVPRTRVSGQGWSCAAATAAAFVCSRSDELAPEASYPAITALVHVDSDAADSLIPSATVDGGGVANPASAYDPTAIAAVPFGIEHLATSVTGSSREPFTQAAGHPFVANSTFVLNYVPGDESGDLITAGGVTVKDAEADLPPGFIGNPQDSQRCATSIKHLALCPAGSIVGFASLALADASIVGGRAQPFSGAEVTPIWSLVPQPNHAAEFGLIVAGGLPIVLAAKVRSNGNYGITIGDEYVGRNGPAPLGMSLTLCSDGVTGSIVNEHLINGACATSPQAGIAGPFLTLPAQCSGPAPVTTLRITSWEHPDDYVSASTFNGADVVSGAPSPTESFVSGCDALQFAPTIEFGPTPGTEGGTSEADQPTGAAFDLHVPQAKEEAAVDGTPELRNVTVTLPEGMTADPSAANGLQTCSNAQFGRGATAEPAQPAECPLASQIGTVEVCTPLLANDTGEALSGEQVNRECEEGKARPALEGQVFVGQPECSPCTAADAEEGKLLRLLVQIRAKERGVIVKLAGDVDANSLTGRLQATFREQPELPFGELRLKLKGGPRAPLANPQTCGAATTTTDMTPWSAPGLGGLSGSEPIEGTPEATPSSSFTVDWDGVGGACPPTLPFGPSFSSGSEAPTAGATSPFSVEVRRQDREQDISGITVTTPPGLLGNVRGVQQCAEAQANDGTCGSASQIGTAMIAAGAGPNPYYLTGNVYLTGAYHGAPFGLSIAVPAEAGPFKLAGNTGNGLEVLRATVAVNPSTAALTITSDPVPQVVDGVPLRLRVIHVAVNRPGFTLNPTNCGKADVAATIAGSQGATASVSSPFGLVGCASLAFAPKLTASTQAHTSRAEGASLSVTVTSAPGQANIGKVDLQLPKALPARLIPTLQHACAEAQFAANPAGCPSDSFVGAATALTPILDAPLSGPAILVSHGGAAFPDLEFLLQGENGIEIVLDGKTEIKKGITYSQFDSLPDAPISRFVTTLPEGPHSILATDLPASAKGSMCGRRLTMPTTITAQSGKQIIQTTKISVTGCKAAKFTNAQKLARALKACRRKGKAHRPACEVAARKRYPRITKTTRTSRTAVRR